MRVFEFRSLGMAAYSFVTQWKFDQPLEAVWSALDEPADYPQWWPSIISYRDLTPEMKGVGTRAERVVKGRLPYTLRYVTTTTAYQPPREIAYDAAGQLNGRGRFMLDEAGGQTTVTFYWDVETSGFWLNLLAPALKRLFAWNHHWVMAQGERGLAKWLAARRNARSSLGRG
jgi:uncharacterized protein YndB with AHSA1/START domain